jgi:hypothetical protein
MALFRWAWAGDAVKAITANPDNAVIPKHLTNFIMAGLSQKNGLRRLPEASR